MGFNQIGALGYTKTLPAFTMSLAAGEVFLLPAGQGVVSAFSASSNLAQTGWTLNGQYLVELGKYTIIQYYDPNLQIWLNWSSAGNMSVFSSDGTNYRIANLTGCVSGALITNGGSGLTNGFNTVTVTPSAGSSTWNTIVGGAINTTITITAGGASYTKPPLLVFNPPAGQGSTPYILPTAYATISGGAVNAVTVVNQGAGLVAAPTITVIPQPGDTTGGGAVLTVNATLVGSGTLLGMFPSYNGTALTSVPTFTFSPASTLAATAIMNFTVTGLTTTTNGSGYASGVTWSIVEGGSNVAGTASGVNPLFDLGLMRTRPAQLTVTTTTTTLSAVTVGVVDAGYGFQAVPPNVYPQYGSGVTQGVLAPTVGGQTDTFRLYNI